MSNERSTNNRLLVFETLDVRRLLAQSLWVGVQSLDVSNLDDTNVCEIVSQDLDARLKRDADDGKPPDNCEPILVACFAERDTLRLGQLGSDSHGDNNGTHHLPRVGNRDTHPTPNADAAGQFDLVLNEDTVGTLFDIDIEGADAAGQFDLVLNGDAVETLLDIQRGDAAGQLLPVLDLIAPDVLCAQQAVPCHSYHSCFISYSHNDEEFATQLHSRLQREGVRVWYARKDMKGGCTVHEQIGQAIRDHDKLLLVLSEHSMASEWVETEIRHARRRELQEGKRILFPISLVPFDTVRGWSAFDADIGEDTAVKIREFFILDFSNWNDHDAFEATFKRLLEGLKA